MRRIAQDRSAFRAFYRDHVEAVQRFIARRVDDPYLAADLMADVFVAVIDSASTYRGSGAELAWLRAAHPFRHRQPDLDGGMR